jgi:hypothetical protein
MELYFLFADDQLELPVWPQSHHMIVKIMLKKITYNQRHATFPGES